ncbi:MAG TPA: nucleotidyltransferase family protein [bacterium]|nr:nucleotidyltransferase family protein [bacterium]
MDWTNTNSFNTGIVVLAAGRSERMGSPKPLARVGGKTLLEHILSNPFLSRENVKPVIVLGHRHEEIQAQVPLNFPFAINAEYEKGRTTSVQAGLRALAREVDGVMIWPVDCPIVPEEVLNRLLDTFTGPGGICVPSCNNRRGHPPLIGSVYFEEILTLESGQSLRDLYARHPEALRHVVVDTDLILSNLNTPEDLIFFEERYKPWLKRNRIAEGGVTT